MSQNIANLLGRVAGGGHLSLEEMSAAIDAIMRGEWSEDEIGLLLTALAAKGETVDEVAGAAMAMRRHMTHIRSRHPKVLDTCGTGGGGSKMFNVSTTAAIVAAAAGVPVAKHGNRSITSRSGSADVLTELGVNINATVAAGRSLPRRARDLLLLRTAHAPIDEARGSSAQAAGHPHDFQYPGPAREPGGRVLSAFGAGRPELRPLLAGAMAKLGTKRTLVVSGEDGLGDVTLAGVTHVTEVSGSRTREFVWTPEDFGIERGSLESLAVDGPRASAAIIRDILAGERGRARDLVVLNTAAGLVAAGKTNDTKNAAMQAAAAIDSGTAKELLTRLSEKSHAAP